MKTVYVVYKMNDGAILSDSFEIEGKINQLSVQKAVRDHFSYSYTYDKYNFDRIISWQEEEPFTAEERDEFWKNY